MPENKIPYTQCLLHTGKKVYKYWLATLAVIGIIIGLGWIIASEWKQIIDFTKGVENAINSIGYVLSTISNNAWTLISSIPWYWWVVAGVTVGPFILVAIYCAVKRYDVKVEHVICSVAVVISFAAVWGIANFMTSVVDMNITVIDFTIGGLSVLWWSVILFVIGSIVGDE